MQYISNGKATVILLTVEFIKTSYKSQMSEYFSEPKCFGRRVKVELDLSNYATKSGLKMKQVMKHQNLRKRLI